MSCHLYVRRRPQPYRGLIPVLRKGDDLALRCDAHDIDMPLNDTTPETILAVANAHRRGVRMAGSNLN